MIGVIAQYFASPITADDETKYGHHIGDNKGQQVWEALAILVAVDLWASEWQQERIVLKIRGDNVTALTLLTKMRPSGPIMAIVARELAMRLVNLSFPPDAEHTPGVGHVFADKLSRVFAPTGAGAITPDLHPAMANASVAIAPTRDATWYKT